MKENCRLYSNHTKKCCDYIKLLDDKHKVPTFAPQISRQHFYRYRQLTEFRLLVLKEHFTSFFSTSIHTNACHVVSIRSASEELARSRAVVDVPSPKRENLNDKFDALMIDANKKTQLLQKDLKMIRHLSLKIVNSTKNDLIGSSDASHFAEVINNQKKLVKLVNSSINRLDQNEQNLSRIESAVSEIEKKLLRAIGDDRIRSEKFLLDYKAQMDANQRNFFDQINSREERKTVSKPTIVTFIIFVITLGLNNKEWLEYSKKVFIFKSTISSN